ncbi:MAG: single-stranded DNA-binding protein [Symbiobacterium thermophilum]|uniref:Single-stranded DNA-binding protein n=1 Tax=Symbiobacterium thermophilum TaxID=2734 RepID=A0A1Y2T5G8_SYMTR|nr:MAG: single-stranded DNA-binding protein [Symbiobacterium thermophilum]
MLNSVILIGRLTKDPELRYTPSGKAVATIRLAVDRGTVNQQGERETDFIDVVVWERQAETVANYLQKGRLVAVQGRLQIRQYTTQDGQRREKAEVVANTVRFLDSARDHAGAGVAAPEVSREDGMGSEVLLDDDEDVPF